MLTQIFIGEELEAFLSRKGVEYDHIAYVGDGTNDFCPILRLRRWLIVISLLRINH